DHRRGRRGRVLGHADVLAGADPPRPRRSRRAGGRGERGLEPPRLPHRARARGEAGAPRRGGGGARRGRGRGRAGHAERAAGGVLMVLAAVALAPGLALGSFLNVVAARVPLRRSLVKPGSACMSCGHEIAWRDNVPVVSWLLLRGRCRNCRTAIPWRYPAVEVLSALLVAGSVWKFGLHPETLVAAFFCLALVAVSATDVEHGIIPNRIVLPAAAVVLAAQTAIRPSPQWAIGAFAASGFLFAA